MTIEDIILAACEGRDERSLCVSELTERRGDACAVGALESALSEVIELVGPDSIRAIVQAQIAIRKKAEKARE
jgi:hypothetical protein